MGIVSARDGAETLLISTDPAPSLGDALEQTLGPGPRAVRAVRGLHAVEVDAKKALDAYLETRRATLEEIALRGTWLDRDDVSRLLRLSLPGIDEVAGLLQIAAFGRDGRYQRIIVDTAPTGHLLRMLEMPAVLQAVAHVFDHMQAKHRVMVDALRGGWAPDAADLLIDEIGRDAADLMAMLRDPARAQLTWVTLPELMAVEETVDGIRWLHDHAITVDAVIVNRVTTPPPGPCRWCDARRRQESHAIAVLARRAHPGARRVTIPALQREPQGIRALAALGKLMKTSRRIVAAPRRGDAAVIPAVLPAGIAGPERPGIVTGDMRLAMFGGKGGVGKTTCAAAAAIDVASADPGRRVLLLSTDPAHSVGDALGQRLSDTPARVDGGPPNLVVRELDAARAFGRLRERIASGIEELFARVSGGGLEGSLATHDRQVMRDLMDLAPPGVDELVAVIEVIDSLIDPDARRGETSGRKRAAGDAGRFDLVVMDTAPTGHALRLIEMPGLVHDWVKAVMAILLKYQPVVGLGDLGSVLLRLSQGLGRLRAVLGDPVHTRFVAVTRAAALPRAETVRLLERLALASISAPIVIVNAVGAGTCRRCDAERQAQAKEIAALRRSLPRSGRRHAGLVIAPAELPPPHGAKRLAHWRRTWRDLTGRPASRARRSP